MIVLTNLLVSPEEPLEFVIPNHCGITDVYPVR